MAVSCKSAKAHLHVAFQSGSALNSSTIRGSSAEGDYAAEATETAVSEAEASEARWKKNDDRTPQGGGKRADGGRRTASRKSMIGTPQFQQPAKPTETYDGEIPTLRIGVRPVPTGLEMPQGPAPCVGCCWSRQASTVQWRRHLRRRGKLSFGRERHCLGDYGQLS